MAEKKLKHWWWHASDLLHFAFNFLRYTFMCGIENVVVQFIPEDPDHDGAPMLHIIDTRDGTVLGSYNYAHTCPPDCF